MNKLMDPFNLSLVLEVCAGNRLLVVTSVDRKANEMTVKVYDAHDDDAVNKAFSEPSVYTHNSRIKNE